MLLFLEKLPLVAPGDQGAVRRLFDAENMDAKDACCLLKVRIMVSLNKLSEFRISM